MKRIIFCFLIIISSGAICNAQQALTTTAGEATAAGGNASYSVGQVVYTTNTGTNSSVAQGIQQPYEISVVTGLEDAKGITLQCSVYPNPTSDFLTLKVENFSLSTLTFQLYDLNGKLLENKKIESNETSIVMSNLNRAAYFLKVIQYNKEIKTFKIVKN